MSPSDYFAIHILSRHVRRVQVRREWLFQWRCHTTDFLKFSEFKYERKRVHFSPYEFFFIISIYTWCMKDKNVVLLPYARIHGYERHMYIQGCKSKGGVKCLWERDLMRGTLPWVLFLYTINVECMCDATTENTEDNM